MKKPERAPWKVERPGRPERSTAMVAQAMATRSTVSTPRATVIGKPAYAPQVKAWDVDNGHYLVSSESQPGTYYSVSIFAHTCTCAAGQHDFKNCHSGECKHLPIARSAHRVQLAWRSGACA